MSGPLTLCLLDSQSGFFFYVVQGFSKTNSEKSLSICIYKYKEVKITVLLRQKVNWSLDFPSIWSVFPMGGYLYQNRCMAYTLSSKRQCFHVCLSWRVSLDHKVQSLYVGLLSINLSCLSWIHFYFQPSTDLLAMSFTK